MKKRFEYKTIVIEPTGFWKTNLDPVEIDKQLNTLGSEGWELIAVESKEFSGTNYGFHYTFKREI